MHLVACVVYRMISICLRTTKHTTELAQDYKQIKCMFGWMIASCLEIASFSRWKKLHAEKWKDQYNDVVHICMRNFHACKIEQSMKIVIRNLRLLSQQTLTDTRKKLHVGGPPVLVIRSVSLAAFVIQNKVEKHNEYGHKSCHVFGVWLMVYNCLRHSLVGDIVLSASVLCASLARDSMCFRLFALDVLGTSTVATQRTQQTLHQTNWTDSLSHV